MIATLDGYVDTTERQNFVLSGNLVAEFETGDIKHTCFSVLSSSIAIGKRPLHRLLGWVTEDFEANGPLRQTAMVRIHCGSPTRSPSPLVMTTRYRPHGFSLYVQDEIELTDQLTVVLGARFDSFDIEV
jgi:catecholate siderophore receptor